MADRIAQAIVQQTLEPEPPLHPDAYGYRPEQSAHPALQRSDRKRALWAPGKFKRWRRHRRRAEQWLRRVAHRQPGRFAHWRVLHRQAG